jgi:hypothetical protein
MPSQKFTLRLPPALATAVQTHLDATGLLFADLARAALSAYLADTQPTGADSTADTLADRLTTLERALEALTRRIEAIEQGPTPSRQSADRSGQLLADSERTGADRQGQGYDASRFVLGRLCPRGHDYQGTGQTLRKRHSGTCAACEREQQRERRAARRQATQ